MGAPRTGIDHLVQTYKFTHFPVGVKGDRGENLQVFCFSYIYLFAEGSLILLGRNLLEHNLETPDHVTCQVHINPKGTARDRIHKSLSGIAFRVIPSKPSRLCHIPYYQTKVSGNSIRINILILTTKNTGKSLI